MYHLDIRTRILERKNAATPATRRVFRFGTVCYIGSLIICVIAFFHKTLTPLGIYTHPPIWVFLMAHAIAILGGLAVAYFFIYTLPGRVRWPSGAVSGRLCYGFTFAALAWGLPSLLVHFDATPVRLEAEIHGSGDLVGRRILSCRKSLTFGPWYAPGGSVCYNIPEPSIMIGSTLALQGNGNYWATLITNIEGSYLR